MQRRAVRATGAPGGGQSSSPAVGMTRQESSLAGGAVCTLCVVGHPRFREWPDLRRRQNGDGKFFTRTRYERGD